MDYHGEKNKLTKVGMKAISTMMRSPEFLARTETLGGYIFVCDNDYTMKESFRRGFFGLPHRYKDSVRAIRPGLPLFLYNKQTGQLHGVFEATSFGGIDIDPLAWPNINYPGQSRFSAQVRVRRKYLCPPLAAATFRLLAKYFTPIRFRVELTVPEVIDILDTFNGSDINTLVHKG